jgi:Ca2+-binding RTX toxin-like protein
MTTTITIAVVALEDDPLAPGQKALYVSGTTGDDTIAITPSANTGAVEVSINGVSQGIFTPQSRLVVYGQAGNDNIQVAGGVTLSAWLYGGAGNDRLYGGGGTSVMLGGDGDDTLIGGQGRDLLIGGAGADQLVGNAGDDILIGGTTSADGNEAALAILVAEWNLTTASYGDRAAYVIAYLTVYDDLAANTLTGSSGEDLFYSGIYDTISGRTSDEIVATSV